MYVYCINKLYKTNYLLFSCTHLSGYIVVILGLEHSAQLSQDPVFGYEHIVIVSNYHLLWSQELMTLIALSIYQQDHCL